MIYKDSIRFCDGIDNDTVLSESEVEDFVTNDALDLAEGTTIGGKALQEAISCQPGQILEYSGIFRRWGCADDSVLTSDDVLGYVTQNPIDLADGSSINTSPILTESSSLQWSNINGVPSDLGDGDDNTQLSQSDVVSFVTDSQVNLGAGSQVNGSDILTSDSTLSVDWSNITSVPAGLDDGNALDALNCTEGQEAIKGSSGWTCQSLPIFGQRW